jgi:hypothetical protein
MIVDGLVTSCTTEIVLVNIHNSPVTFHLEIVSLKSTQKIVSVPVQHFVGHKNERIEMHVTFGILSVSHFMCWIKLVTGNSS